MLAFLGIAKKAADDLSKPDGDNSMFGNKNNSETGTTDAKIDGSMNFTLNTTGAQDGGRSAMDAAKGAAGGGGGKSSPPPPSR